MRTGSIPKKLSTPAIDSPCRDLVLVVICSDDKLGGQLHSKTRDKTRTFSQKKGERKEKT